MNAFSRVPGQRLSPAATTILKIEKAGEWPIAVRFSYPSDWHASRTPPNTLSISMSNGCLKKEGRKKKGKKEGRKKKGEKRRVKKGK